MNASLVSVAAADAAIAAGHEVALSAYVLTRTSATVGALERAADRGSRVDVVLDGSPYVGGSTGGLARANAGTAGELAAHGVRVRITHPPASMHLKAAVVDGVAYLDDRNWTASGDDLVIRFVAPNDVALVTRALTGDARDGPGIAMEKRGALALEAATIAAAPADRIDVASESFGDGPVARALARRAAAGARVRVLVGAAALDRDRGREATTLARLAAAGVEIETTPDEHKLCVAGDRAWIGSANSTYAPSATPDWGAIVENSATVAAIAARFDAAWAAGTSVRRG